MWPFRSKEERNAERSKIHQSRGSRQIEGRLSARFKDVHEMVEALGNETDPLDRHFLYEAIVRESFRLRMDDHKMRDLCERMGMRHLKEFPQMAERLRREIGYGTMPPVATFRCMGTLMTEWGAYQKAIDIYEKALSYGIDDDTDGGFQRKIAALRQLMR